MLNSWYRDWHEVKQYGAKDRDARASFRAIEEALKQVASNGYAGIADQFREHIRHVSEYGGRYGADPRWGPQMRALWFAFGQDVADRMMGSDEKAT